MATGGPASESPAGGKAPDAFRTIGELSSELGVAQHILRYWETKFPQLRPLQRAGNRRYYRPQDVALARRIHRLLGDEGYTVKGVQKLLQAKGSSESPAPAPIAPPPLEPTTIAATQFAQPVPSAAASGPTATSGIDVERLVELRDRLSAALSG